jgi:hypothetical protein
VSPGDLNAKILQHVFVVDDLGCNRCSIRNYRISLTFVIWQGEEFEDTKGIS